MWSATPCSLISDELPEYGENFLVQSATEPPLIKVPTCLPASNEELAYARCCADVDTCEVADEEVSMPAGEPATPPAAEGSSPWLINVLVPTEGAAATPVGGTLIFRWTAEVDGESSLSEAPPLCSSFDLFLRDGHRAALTIALGAEEKDGSGGPIDFVWKVPSDVMPGFYSVHVSCSGQDDTGTDTPIFEVVTAPKPETGVGTEKKDHGSSVIEGEELAPHAEGSTDDSALEGGIEDGTRSENSKSGGAGDDMEAADGADDTESSEKDGSDVATPAWSIDVTAPKAGAAVPAEETLTFSWTATRVGSPYSPELCGSFDLYLYDSKGSAFTGQAIALRVMSSSTSSRTVPSPEGEASGGGSGGATMDVPFSRSSSFVWYVPPEVPPGAYTAQVSCSGAGATGITSPPFELLATPFPTSEPAPRPTAEPVLRPVPRPTPNPTVAPHLAAPLSTAPTAKPENAPLPPPTPSPVHWPTGRPVAAPLVHAPSGVSDAALIPAPTSVPGKEKEVEEELDVNEGGDQGTSGEDNGTGSGTDDGSDPGEPPLEDDDTVFGALTDDDDLYGKSEPADVVEAVEGDIDDDNLNTGSAEDGGANAPDKGPQSGAEGSVAGIDEQNDGNDGDFDDLDFDDLDDSDDLDDIDVDEYYYSYFYYHDDGNDEFSNGWGDGYDDDLLSEDGVHHQSNVNKKHQEQSSGADGFDFGDDTPDDEGDVGEQDWQK